VNRFQFVADHQRRYGVKRLCQVLGIARSSFYYWQATAAARARKRAEDARLAARIRAVHAGSDGTYGVPRITAELHDAGERVNHKKVAWLMKASGIAGLRLRRRQRTTVADPAAAKAPDLVGRDFTAREVNTKYVGDITYLPVGGARFCYLVLAHVGIPKVCSFHMTLSYSRDPFCCFTTSRDLATFFDCHRQAFAHFPSPGTTTSTSTCWPPTGPPARTGSSGR
jgi:hypothetical protein